MGFVNCCESSFAISPNRLFFQPIPRPFPGAVVKSITICAFTGAWSLAGIANYERQIESSYIKSCRIRGGSFKISQNFFIGIVNIKNISIGRSGRCIKYVYGFVNFLPIHRKMKNQFRVLASVDFFLRVQKSYILLKFRMIIHNITREVFS